MWVLGTHTHIYTKNNLDEPLQAVSLKESRPQANMHFMWNWKSTLQYVLCFSDPQASLYLRCQFGDIMQNGVERVNFINWGLLRTLSTKFPKDTEILFSFHYGKHQTCTKVDQKYKKSCSHHPDFKTINSQSYDLDFHPFPPSYYFKAQPKHYFISSANIFIVSLEEFFLTQQVTLSHLKS